MAKLMRGREHLWNAVCLLGVDKVKGAFLITSGGASVRPKVGFGRVSVCRSIPDCRNFAGNRFGQISPRRELTESSIARLPSTHSASRFPRSYSPTILRTNPVCNRSFTSPGIPQMTQFVVDLYLADNCPNDPVCNPSLPCQ